MRISTLIEKTKGILRILWKNMGLVQGLSAK